jgi:tetratricopeptide (TPR) repeat protein
MKKTERLLLLPLMFITAWAMPWSAFPFCEEPPKAQAKDAVQKKMATGIAAFDRGEYSRAANAFKQVLHLNPSPADTSVAYKYLAFYYCINGAEMQCEAEFIRALQADAEFALEPAEQNHHTWAKVYARALGKHQRQCVASPARQAVTPVMWSEPKERGASETQSLAAVKSSRVAEPAGEPVAPQINKEAARKGVSILRLDVFPWGTVYIDGKQIALTPPQKEVEVAAGTSRVEIRNKSVSAFTRTYTLVPGEEVVLSYRF